MSNTVTYIEEMVEKGLTEYPLIRKEVEYDTLENPPSFPKYMKKYQQNEKEFDMLWKQCLGIKQLFRDFSFIYRTCFTDTSFYKMLETYAEIEMAIKSFNKDLKKCNPVVKEYYSNEGFCEFFNINVFDLIKKDYETYYPIAKERHKEYVNKYVDVIPVLNDDVTDYLKEYKNAIKKVKSKRDASNKKAA